MLAAEHRTDELRLQRHSDAKLRDRGGLCSSAWSNRRRSHVLGEPAEQPFRMLTEMVVSVETLVGFLNPKQFLFVSTQGIEDGLTVGLSVDEEVSAKSAPSLWAP